MKAENEEIKDREGLIFSEGEELERTRAFFDGDRFAVENGAVIEAIGENYAKCSIRLTEHHRNAMGAVMGGAYFTLADFTFAVAANWRRPQMVSLSSSVTFCGAAKGELLIAEAHCVRSGRSTCYYQVDVKDELGNLAAAVVISGFRRWE